MNTVSEYSPALSTHFNASNASEQVFPIPGSAERIRWLKQIK